MLLLFRLLVLSCVFLCSVAFADQFVIHKIKVEGNHRVSVGTILSYLPVKEGDKIDSSQTSDIIRALYNTGFFSDVKLTQNKGTLIVTVIERSVIGSINISGNKKVTDKQLLEVLKNAGLSEGQAFDNSAFTELERALVQQYYSLGYYGVKIQTSIVPEQRNRVAVNVKVTEGPAAKITSIKIIGNHEFTEKQLLKNFSLSPSSFFALTFFTHADQYAKEKLDADLEKLHTFYLDRGYLHFNIDAAQVSITPDKKHIYINIYITEGHVFTIRGYSLTGDFIGHRDQFQALVDLRRGDVFSRKKILDIQSAMNELFGNYGYGMPVIRIDPNINETTHQVFVNFVVEPGKRVYVRRINFTGNTKTDDEVLRREMRQQEGGVFSLSKINESKRRLSNLGYLQDVDSKVEPVPGHCDQVDLLFKVKEVSAVSANFQAGYSDADGFLYGVSLNDQNFLGTGKSVSMGFDHSLDYQTYNVSYYNPYFTINNISLLLNAYLQQNQPGRISLTAYTSDVYGASATYGIPFSDYNRLSFGYGYEVIKIGTSIASSEQVIDFINDNGNVFNELKLMTGWSFTNQDRAIFPTRGLAQAISIEAGFPVGSNSMDYYKSNYTLSWYHPVISSFIAHARAQLGYGNGFGKTKSLPFFKNYYAGGIDSVRGYQVSSLGPLGSDGNPLGGNFLTTGSLSLIFPNPVGEALRTSVFADVGNVYDDTFAVSQLRGSYGLQGEWRSPLGPLVFSIAKTMMTHSGDRKDFFQFNIGTSI